MSDCSSKKSLTDLVVNKVPSDLKSADNGYYLKKVPRFEANFDIFSRRQQVLIGYLEATSIVQAKQPEVIQSTFLY